MKMILMFMCSLLLRAHVKNDKNRFQHIIVIIEIIELYVCSVISVFIMFITTESTCKSRIIYITSTVKSADTEHIDIDNSFY